MDLRASEDTLSFAAIHTRAAVKYQPLGRDNEFQSFCIVSWVFLRCGNIYVLLCQITLVNISFNITVPLDRRTPQV